MSGDAGPDARDDADGGSRSVLRRAVGNAVLRGDSWVLRSYGVVAVALAAFVGLLVVLALPQWASLTEDAGTIQRVGRAFLVLVGLGVVAATLLPLLLVERRRRAGRPQRQRAFGLAGYAFVASLYLALVVSAPADARSEPPAALAPLVDALYGLPPAAAGALLVAGVGAILAVERGVGRSDAPQ